MMESDVQLELFELPPQAPAQRSMTSLGSLHLRADHAVLTLIVGLIGFSVVFALGVERGKQLVQAERPLWDSRASVSHDAPPAQASPDGKVRSSTTSGSSTSASDQAPTATPRAVPATEKGRVAPTKTVTNKSRFAIQVVSYTQLKLAQRELDRLKRRGEQAFLVTTQERVALLVGPFPTKTNASVKLARLRSQYQDCFIRNL